jgi:nicotinamide-nucleotide amidase
MRTPTVEILSQGDEVVTGQIVDTNAAWLAERLTALGLQVSRHVTVGDELGAIREAVALAAERADVVVCTGGLGPTEDDLTAEAVAAAAGVPLEHDHEAERQLRAMYARYRREMPEVNLKQVQLPRGAERLDNAWGTAPGFAVELSGAWLAFMPGVPREMRAMFDARVVPRLSARLAVAPRPLIVIRTAGIGESNLQERIGPFSDPDAVLSYRTALPENHVKLRFRAGVAPERIGALAMDIVGRIGSPVFAVDGLPSMPSGSLAAVVGAARTDRGQTLAVAESCTGGRVASMCTAESGSSAWFLEGVVTYANAAKERRLGVPADLLAEHGAVSEPVARRMARGVREACGATWGLSTTGVAGPTGGTEHKPVGTVHVALAGPGGELHRQLALGGDRGRIQALSAATALDLLRRVLQGHISLD